jgi:putative glutamine amidotransferase
MAAPIIGITTQRAATAGSIPVVGSPESYIQAVQNAGGLPLLIPLDLTTPELDEVFSHLDGVLLHGGGDIDPVFFQGPAHSAVYGIDPDRDRVELHLVRQAAGSGKPFFGICRGIQVINVALGGTLYTHIHDQHPNALRHDWYPDIPRDYLAHPVQVAENSSLTKILGKSNVATNSLHHQGIHQPAPRLIPVAWAPDGIIEAVELTGHPFGLGVQWHPENLQAYPEMRALFQALVSAARLP